MTDADDGKRSLYRVWAVDPRGAGQVLMDGKPVIADGVDKAMLKSGVAQIAAEKGLELEQIDTYVEHVAKFIRKRKETQKVKISKDDDD